MGDMAGLGGLERQIAQKLLANSGEEEYGWNNLTSLILFWMLGVSFERKVGACFISGMIPVCLNCFGPVTLGFRSWWRWEDRSLMLKAATAWHRHGEPVRAVGQGASTVLFLGGVGERWWRQLCEGWSKLHQVLLSFVDPLWSLSTWHGYPALSQSLPPPWPLGHWPKKQRAEGGTGAGVRGIMWCD